MGIFKLCFQAESKFLALKLIPRLAPFTEGIKFATQISPLLNYYYFTILYLYIKKTSEGVVLQLFEKHWFIYLMQFKFAQNHCLP